MPAEAYGIGTRTCEACGVTYKPYLATQRWCSPQCRRRGKNRHLAQLRLEGKAKRYRANPDDPCRRCGGEKEHSVRRNALCLSCRSEQPERSAADLLRRREPTDEATFLQHVIRDPCVYCGAGFTGPPNSALDHIHAWSGGGRDGWENRAAICRSCNSSKHGMGLLDFLLYQRILDEVLPPMREALTLGRSFGVSARWLDSALSRKGY